MRDRKIIKNAIISLTIAVLAAISVVAVNAQNVSKEYRDWQRSVQRANRERQDYFRTHRRSDYVQWQNAQQRAKREYQQYLNATRRYNNDRRNDRYDRHDNNRYRGRYRVGRNGSYYWTDSRGLELLRQAVRNGYRQGYEQGLLDRRHRRVYNFGVSPMYRSGYYGYNAYVPRTQYQYYFQQGFQRGYEDGYYSRTRYGYRNGNAVNVLSGVINTILDIVD